MEKLLFGSEARNRLIGIDAYNGAKRFDNVCAFAQIALDHLDTPLVVPPSIDQDLHEILSARDDEGNGFEMQKITHRTALFLGETVGKSIRELEHPMAKKSVEVLESSGFPITEECYQAPACILRVLL